MYTPIIRSNEEHRRMEEEARLLNEKRRSKNTILRLVVTTMISICMGVVLVSIADCNRQSVIEYEMHGPVSIESAEKFRKVLKIVPTGTTINMHIESFGGLILSRNKIIYYMQNSGVFVNCFVDSHAMSAGASILMACNTINVAPKAKIMFHMPRICVTVTCITRRALLPSDEGYQRAILDLSQTKTILTTKEWDSMMLGEDVNLYGDELMKRLRSK